MAQVLFIAIIILVTLCALAYLAQSSLGRSDTIKKPMLQLLPGDIEYQSPSGNFRFYFPVTTSIVLAIVLSLVMRYLS